jgi:hypothetical protein
MKAIRGILECETTFKSRDSVDVVNVVSRDRRRKVEAATAGDHLFE